MRNHRLWRENAPHPASNFNAHRLRVAATRRSFLMSVPLFQSLSDAQLTRVATSLKRRTFTAGKVIIKQGDRGDDFFLLHKGAMCVYKHVSGSFPGDLEGNVSSSADYGAFVGQLSAGDFFGERALMTQEPRAATIVALQASVCYVLDKASFESVISGVETLIGKHVGQRGSDEEDALSLEEHVGRYAQLLSRVVEGHGKDSSAGQREKALLRLFSSFSPELCYEDIVERMVSITCVPSQPRDPFARPLTAFTALAHR